MKDPIISRFIQMTNDRLIQSVSKAIIKHGFDINKIEEDEFKKIQALGSEFEILVHIPTGKHICRFSAQPTFEWEGNTVKSTYLFQEL